MYNSKKNVTSCYNPESRTLSLIQMDRSSTKFFSMTSQRCKSESRALMKHAPRIYKTVKANTSTMRQTAATLLASTSTSRASLSALQMNPYLVDDEALRFLQWRTQMKLNQFAPLPAVANSDDDIDNNDSAKEGSEIEAEIEKEPSSDEKQETPIRSLKLRPVSAPPAQNKRACKVKVAFGSTLR